MILLLCLSQGVQAGPHNTGLISSLNLGVRYSSLLQNRGLVFYEDFQIDPVLGVFFLDDKIEFLGDSIGYRDFIYADKIRFRTKLASLTDKPLFPDRDAHKISSGRKETQEWVNGFEFFIPGYNENYQAEIDFSYAKDIAAHRGTYLELQSKIKLFDFRLFHVETLIEPNLFLSLGWGDERHNKYLYGPSANKAEINNYAYGVWFAFPEEADRFYPIIQIKHFSVTGKSKDAEFSKEKSGFLISFIATYGILPF